MKDSRAVVIEGARLYGAGTPIDIRIEAGRIAAVVHAGTPGPGPAASRRVDGRGLAAVPGFVDLHVHGGAGSDFMDATEDAFRAISDFHASGGTTAYLPTTATESA